MADNDTDFLNDINEALDNGGKAPDAPVTTDVTPQQKPQHFERDQSAAQSVEQNILDHMGDDDEQDVFEGMDTKSQQDKAAKDAKEKEEAAAKKAAEQTQQQQPATKEVEQNVQTQGQGNDQRRNRQDSPLDVYLKQDDKGNFIFSDGTLAVPAGRARDFFENVRSAGREAREQGQQIANNAIKLAEKFRELNTEYNKLKDGGLTNVASSVGASEKELQQAISYMTEYKNNPINAIKRLLTEAQMNGINLKDIGINGGADPATVTSVVKSQLQELLGPLTQRTEREEVDRTAIEEATQFLKDFPDAQRFVEPIEKAKAQFPDMSYVEIWARLLPYVRQAKPQQQQQQQETQKSADTTVVTDQQQQQQPPREQQQQTPPRQQDYSTMSFDQIAKSILQERQKP